MWELRTWRLSLSCVVWGILFAVAPVSAGSLSGFVGQSVSPITSARVSIESTDVPGGIHGIVTNRSTSMPVSGAQVFIDAPPVFAGSAPFIAVSNASGEYQIPDLVPGSYNIGIWAEGFETDYELNIDVAAGASTERNCVVSSVAVDDEFLTVIRIEFDNLAFHPGHDEAWFDQFLFDSTPGAASVRNYFYEISHGRMRIQKGVNVLIHCSQTDLQYPHENAMRDDLADWALPAANSIINFAASNLDRFDNNDRTPGADGDIDHVLLIPAGMSQSITGATDCDMNPVNMWNTVYNLDGKQSGYQTLCPEYSPLGNFVHELMHSMGENYVQDLYIGGTCEDENEDDLSTAAKWALLDVGMYNDLISIPPDPRTGGCLPYIQPCGVGDPDCWTHENGENPSHPVPWTSRVRWYHGFFNSLLISESLTAGQSRSIRLYPYESSGPETRTIIAYDPDVSTAYWYITLRLPLGFDHGLDLPGDIPGETGVVIDYTDNALAGTMPLRGPVRVRDSHPDTAPPSYLHYACRFQLDDAAFNLSEVNAYDERSLHVDIINEYADGSVQIQISLDAKSNSDTEIARLEFDGLPQEYTEPMELDYCLASGVRGSNRSEPEHRVQRKSRVQYETLTNDQGMYSFPNLDDGIWNFEIRACGYALYPATVAVEGVTQKNADLVPDENLAPDAVITAPVAGNQLSPVALNASGSSDPESQPLSYQWVSDVDGLVSELSIDTAVLSLGTHLLTLTVSDGFCSDSSDVLITVINPTSTPTPPVSPTPTGAVFTSTPSPNPTSTPTPSPAQTGSFCSGQQLYSSSPALAILDDGCPEQQLDTIHVPESALIYGVRVRVNITHTFDADLDFYIEHPSGVVVELSTDNGSNGDHYTDTVFDDAASIAISSGQAPFTGTYRPETPLSALTGLNAEGDWIFRICDDMYAGTGTLVSWDLCINYENPPQTATQTHTAAPPTSTLTPASTRTASPTATPTSVQSPNPTATASRTPTASTPTPPTPNPTLPPTQTPTTQPYTQTPAPSSTATNSPTQTATVTPTATGSSSHTPAVTSTPTGTPVFTATPWPTTTTTPQPSMTPTTSPTAPTSPTPATFACDLLLSDTMFEAGMPFRLEIEIHNGTSTGYNLHQYLILDVFGSYFFHPSWDNELDYTYSSISRGYHGTSTVFDFVWPEVSGGADGLKFYLGYLDAATLELVGNIDIEEFGYR